MGAPFSARVATPSSMTDQTARRAARERRAGHARLRGGGALGARWARLTLGLFVLNAALQMCDGVANYLGCRAGMVEGNPMVAYAMQCFGLGAGVVAAKLVAVACLAALWVVRGHRLVPAALTLTASAYVAFSALPWAAALLLPLPG